MQFSRTAKPRRLFEQSPVEPVGLLLAQSSEHDRPWSHQTAINRVGGPAWRRNHVQRHWIRACAAVGREADHRDMEPWNVKDKQRLETRWSDPHWHPIVTGGTVSRGKNGNRMPAYVETRPRANACYRNEYYATVEEPVRLLLGSFWPNSQTLKSHSSII